MNFLTQILTNSDNRTHNVLRHGIVWGFLAIVGLQLYAIFKGQVFDVQEFGIAVGALLGGGGAGLGASAKSEVVPPTVP